MVKIVRDRGDSICGVLIDHPRNQSSPAAKPDAADLYFRVRLGPPNLRRLDNTKSRRRRNTGNKPATIQIILTLT